MPTQNPLRTRSRVLGVTLALAVPVLVGCSGGDSATEASDDAWPEQVVEKQGGRYWAAYVAVGETPDDRTLVAAENHLTELGYAPSRKQLSCDEGAPGALDLPPEHTTLAVYFGDEADMREFEERYEKDVVGTAEVTTYCLD